MSQPIRIRIKPQTEPSVESPAQPQLMHQPAFLDQHRADTILQLLQQHVPWGLFAPSPNSRRVYCWEPGHDQTVDAVFTEIIHELQTKYRVRVLGVFCNLYRDGSDHCPYHRDSYGTDVWTLSLGDTRDFLLKPDAAGTHAATYTLRSGDLYFMPQSLHRNHRHSIPARKGAHGVRISLVFFTKTQ